MTKLYVCTHLFDEFEVYTEPVEVSL